MDELLEKFESLVYDRGFIITKKCQRGVLSGFSWIEYVIADYFTNLSITLWPSNQGFEVVFKDEKLEVRTEEDLKKLISLLIKERSKVITTSPSKEERGDG